MNLVSIAYIIKASHCKFFDLENKPDFNYILLIMFWYSIILFCFDYLQVKRAN